METEHFDCQRGSLDHAVRFTLDFNDGNVRLDIRLNRQLPWHKRAWQGLKYILGANVSHVVLLHDDDYNQLRNMLTRSEIAKVGYLSRAREQRREGY